MRATPTTANRVVALLSKMFALAEEWGWRPGASNPCRHIKKFEEASRERLLTADELRRLGDALDAAEREGEHPSGLAIAIARRRFRRSAVGWPVMQRREEQAGEHDHQPT
jgi:hypothetical protein